MNAYIAGLITMGYVVIALCFLRFWRRTRDTLFSAFAAAFALLAAQQGIAALIELGNEARGWVWLLRLAAFTLIIIAIIRKNLAPSR